MSSATTVTTVRTTFRYIFCTMEMTRAGTALTGTAQHLYVIYEVGISHIGSWSNVLSAFVSVGFERSYLEHRSFVIC